MKTTILLTAVLLSTLATSAMAGKNRQYDYAKVTHVEPIYKTIKHRVPHRECWTETVAYERPSHHGHRSHTGTILGGIIGAAIGNEVGHHKRNKQVGAVAGAVLGASIGRDLSKKHRDYNTVTEYRDEERCEVSHSVEYEEQLIGYDVTYRYHGHKYHTRTDTHPGKKIKVSVHVRPVRH